MIIITNIYPAREKPIKNVSSNLIIDYLKKIGHKKTFKTNKINLPNKIKEITKSNDIIITMGAGDIYKSIDKIYNEIKWIELIK